MRIAIPAIKRFVHEIRCQEIGTNLGGEAQGNLQRISPLMGEEAMAYVLRGIRPAS